MRLTLLLVLLSAIYVRAQNCSVTSVNLPPLNDLGLSYWSGFQGGLYPNGSNYRPSLHNQQGLLIASQILPLDVSGNLDLLNGKIVWLSIGMSNTTQETQQFIPMTDTFQMKNPKLQLVDGAQGGQSIDVIMDSTANFWNVINQRLANQGLSPIQVQVIWFKEAEAHPTDTSFLTYPDSLKEKFKIVMQIIKSKYANASLCYLSSRIYAGYATGALNPEPYAWYSGWSVKRLIEDQVNGDPLLSYFDINPVSPWLAWGPYLWADGLTPRSDGLTWVCPDDFNSDGTHPSPQGRLKVAQMLFDFFSTDSTTTPWFLNNPGTSVPETDNSEFTAFFDISNNHLSITGFNPEESFDLRIYDQGGKEIINQHKITNDLLLSTEGWASGLYLFYISSDKSAQSIKLIKP